MFTISDICHIAVQIERNGENAYRQAAQNTSNPKISELLSRMAEDELRHAEWFRRVVVQQAEAPDCREMEAMGRALLQEMVKDQTFSLQDAMLSKAAAEDALLKQSIEFESDTIAFYEMLMDFVEDDKVRRQLKLIIQEERNHISLLEGVKTTPTGS